MITSKFIKTEPSLWLIPLINIILHETKEVKISKR